MTSDPDKAKTTAEIVARYGGRTERMDDTSITVTIPVEQYREFTAHQEQMTTVASISLLWLARDFGGDRRLQARTVDGAYDIYPRRSQRHRRPRPFLGYDVRYVPLGDGSDDDTDMVDDEDMRVIETGVQSEAEAKAIAQADADARRAVLRS
jgi:hypothetical protein